jgi:hypothetical protein
MTGNGRYAGCRREMRARRPRVNASARDTRARLRRVDGALNCAAAWRALQTAMVNQCRIRVWEVIGFGGGRLFESLGMRVQAARQFPRWWKGLTRTEAAVKNGLADLPVDGRAKILTTVKMDVYFDEPHATWNELDYSIRTSIGSFTVPLIVVCMSRTASSEFGIWRKHARHREDC